MTSENASGATNIANKRVRFTAPVSEPSTNLVETSLTPKGQAIRSVRNYASTLRKHLSPIIIMAGETNMTSAHNWTTKSRQLKKMEDDDEFIPRSARIIDFEFRVNKEVENTEEFKSINAETQILMNDFRLNLKKKVMETLALQIKLIRESLINNIIKQLNLIVAAQLLANGKDTSPHLIISYIMHHHHESFLEQTDIEVDEFNSCYKEFHGLATFPLRLLVLPEDDDAIIPDADATAPAPDLVAIDQARTIALRDDATTCYATVFATLCAPKIIYYEQLHSIEIDINLKKLSTTATLEDAAVSAATRMNLEPSAEPELMKDLVRAQVSSENKKLSAELGQLKRQIAILTNGKPPSKGARTPKGGASTKKKITKKKKAPRTSSSQKVDAQGAASTVKGNEKIKPRRKKKKGQRS